MAPDEDAELVAALRGRDATARRAAEHGLFERFHGPVDRLLRRMLGRDTEDCLQEVFVDVFRGLASFEGKSRLSTWIYRIALRRAWKCAAAGRRARRGREELDLDEQTVLDPGGGGEPLAQRFAEALQHLEPAQRTVLALSAIESLGPGEIAEVLGLPVGTVHSRLSRARERMRELLGLAAEE